MFCGIKLPVTLFLTSLLILVSSCAGLKISPPGPGNQSLLVLPVTVKNTSTTLFYGYSYKYEIVNATTNQVVREPVFKLPNRDGFLMVKSLPPGDYYVSKLITVPVGDLQQLFDQGQTTIEDTLKGNESGAGQDEEVNVKQLRQAAEQGDAEAQYKMGRLLPRI